MKPIEGLGKVWYLAGPMRGLPQCNIPLFDRVTAQLRAEGLAIISPAELDSPDTRAEGLLCRQGDDLRSYGGETPGQILARDVEIVADTADGLILLPGWMDSRGARLEVMVALTFNKEFMEYIGDAAKPVSRTYIRHDLQRCIP